jgi:hypothetical protein
MNYQVSRMAKKYFLIPLGLSVISLVSASQPRIEVRILILYLLSVTFILDLRIL